MTSLKTLFIATTAVALIAVPIVLERERRVRQKAVKQIEERKRIENEYFIDALVDNSQLIGSPLDEFSDIPLTADYTAAAEDFEIGSLLPHRLQLLTPSSRSLAGFSEMFVEADGVVIPKLQSEDLLYIYMNRHAKRRFEEGALDVGYYIFCRRNIIVAVAKGTSHVPL